MGSGQISLDSTAQYLVIMISYLVTLLLVLPALVHGQDYDDYEVDPNAIEGLPASAADLLDAPYDDGFNCDQQDAGYGYYADVNNGCKVPYLQPRVRQRWRGGAHGQVQLCVRRR